MTTHTVSTTDELQQRTADAGPGDEIIARGGTYEMTSRWTVRSEGSSGNPLVIRAADGEVPQIRFDTSGDDSGIQFRGPYVHFIGFEVSNSTWKGVNADGNADNVVFEDLDVHDSYIWGIMNNGCDNVVYRNCDSHHNNGDPANSDGFNMTGPARNGLIEGCRAWANGDDGFDTWVSEDNVIRDCWAWDNGRSGGGTGDGFKLGGGPNEGGNNTIHNCIAFDNMRRGFDWNTTDNPLEVYNNTAINNPINYRFNQNGPYTLRNNISVDGDVQLDSGVDDQYNSWNLGIDDPQFRSTDPDSSEFLRLESSSPAIGAGVAVGLPYVGEAPDLGAYEFGSDTETPSERITVDGEQLLAAEAALRDSDSLFETEHEGFNGEGYVNFVPDDGGYAEWALDVSDAQRYNFEIYYANGSDGDRTANLTFAGDYERITFPQTGGWTNWETMTGTVDLPDGEIDLAIETTGQKAGNVDQIRLWPVESEPPAQTLDGESTLPAEAAVRDPESLFETEHEGFNGEGYVNFVPYSDGYARWALDVPDAQSYNFEIYYANGSDDDRTANLSFAGDYKQITFPQTGGWTNWETMTGTVDLPSGETEFAIETTGQKAGNVDQIRLWPADSESSRSNPVGDTPNHGFSTPEQGQADWHVPLNENFEAIDRAIPIVDQEAAKDEYEPVDRALYIAVNTGTVFVGDGSEWHKLGSFS